VITIIVKEIYLFICSIALGYESRRISSYPHLMLHLRANLFVVLIVVIILSLLSVDYLSKLFIMSLIVILSLL